MCRLGFGHFGVSSLPLAIEAAVLLTIRSHRQPVARDGIVFFGDRNPKRASICAPARNVSRDCSSHGSVIHRCFCTKVEQSGIAAERDV